MCYLPPSIPQGRYALPSTQPPGVYVLPPPKRDACLCVWLPLLPLSLPHLSLADKIEVPACQRWISFAYYDTMWDPTPMFWLILAKLRPQGMMSENAWALLGRLWFSQNARQGRTRAPPGSAGAAPSPPEVFADAHPRKSSENFQNPS